MNDSESRKKPFQTTQQQSTTPIISGIGAAFRKSEAFWPSNMNYGVNLRQLSE